MAAAARSESSDTADREIVTIRVFDAPRDLVFKLWTDPAHVAQWWGPNGFTITTSQMDVRPGGVWRFEMHGSDGKNYANRVTYVDVVRPERLVYKHDDDGAGETSGFDVTATFEELPGGKTKLTMRVVFPTAAAKRYVVEMHSAIEGMNQTLGRLGEKLAVMTAGDGGQEFVISRMFDAPGDRVFEMWTKQEHLMKWFGPKGSTMPVGKLDLRVGGTFHFQLRSADGQEMWARFVFREIDPPQRLVWVHSFSDPAGNLARCPFIPTWPMELLTTVTFDSQQGGPTLVTIRWSTLNATDVERQTFAAAHGSMQQGWTGTFDQLADYLAKAM
jgi:uncharacterized protein YndB with AHSA1/START domain